MLDYFLLKGFVDLDEQGEVNRTKDCPSNLLFEENRDGVVVFYAILTNGQKIILSEPEDWEHLDIKEA